MIIDVRDIRLMHFPEGKLSLQAERGDILGLAGRNGSGKTSLLRWLAGLDPAFTDGDHLSYFSTAEKIRAAMVFQNAEDNLIFSTLREDVKFGLKNLGREFSEEDFRELLKTFQVENLGDRFWQELSSGEKERVAFASIFSQKPDLLLLDEVLASNEPGVAREILSEVFVRCRREGIAVIFVSHDPELLELCGRTAFLENGTILPDSPEGLTPDFGESPFSALLRETGITHGKIRDLPGGLQLTEYQVKGPGHPCLVLDSVRYGVGARDFFDRLSLTLNEGGLYRISGPSGSGKSTLLRIMAGLLRVSEGEVRAFGQMFPGAGKQGWKDIGRVNRHEYLNNIRKMIGYAGQHSERQLFRNTVLEDVGFAPENFGMSGEELHNARVKALYRMEISESLWQRSPRALSIGEQRKTALAGILAADPRILMLDDPYAELDRSGIDALNRVILDYLNQDRTVVIAGGR